MARKKSRKIVQKKKYSIPVSFDCPFCNHHQSVECKIDRKQWIGIIHCRTCNESYQTQINYLSEPIDVYSEWIDECERVNKQADEELQLQHQQDLRMHSMTQGSHASNVPTMRGRVDEEDEEDALDAYGRPTYSSNQRTNRYRHVEEDDEEETDEQLLNYRP